MTQPAWRRSSSDSCPAWAAASLSIVAVTVTVPLPSGLASTPTAIDTWHPVAKRATAAASTASAHRRRGRRSGRADDEKRNGSVVADLVGHRPEQEPRGARHPLVADDEQVVVAALRQLEQPECGVAVARHGVDGGHAGAGHPRRLGGDGRRSALGRADT